MHPFMREYDLVVIGSGPGEQKAAIAAAKLGKTVAIIERDMMLGGVCTNTGTIPSKTLREAVLYLTGITQRELYGASYHVKENITPADLLTRTKHVIGKEQDVVRAQLIRNRIELYTGHGRFIDKHTVLVEDQHGGERVAVSGRYMVIATGTKPAQPPGVEFDEERVLDSDGILNLKFVPASMVVVGAGVIGVEYASMFAALGTKVTVVEKRHTMLDFCDPEIVEALQFHLRELAVTFRFGEEVIAVDVGASGTLTTLASGKQIPAEAVMYSAGRQGQTDHLDLANAGLETDSRNDLISSMTALPALVSVAHNRGRHRSRKRDNHRKSTRLTRFRKCPKGSHAKDRRVRLAGSSGARRAIAAVRHRGICISRTPAFAVAVITPVVFAGAVGAAAPTPMLRDATITPVAVVAPASRDPLGPKVIAIQQQPESFHISAATVSAPPPIGHHEFSRRAGYSDDCAVRIPQCRTNRDRL